MNQTKNIINGTKVLINGTFYDLAEYFKNFDEKAMLQNVISIFKTKHDKLIEILNKEYLNKNIYDIYINVSATINMDLKELKEKIFKLNNTQLIELYEDLESKLKALNKNITENEILEEFKINCQIYSNYIH